VNYRVLLVDDEQRILDALRRTLRGRYAIETASSGADGLQILSEAADRPDTIAVIVSDMMMPGMNGAEFLTRAREIAPDAVRMILSGQADLASTIAAVNNADLFRFLTKPIEPAMLTTALDSALRQYELVISERELLRSTLTGAVDVLVETLALASPLAYRRTARVRMLLTTVAGELGMGDDWRIHVAAMLSQVGCIAVPAPVLEKIEKGALLSDEDRRMYLGHPDLAMQLLGRIPRLEEVADWIGSQITDIDDLTPGPLQEGPQACFAAVAAFLAGYDVGLGLREMERRLDECGRFGHQLVKAVIGAAQVLTPKGEPAEVKVEDIQPGMVLNQDVTTTTGLVLVRKGERVSEVLARRLDNFARSVGVEEPIKVLVLGG
jgi:CheY-like chemotaxis protein